MLRDRSKWDKIQFLCVWMFGCNHKSPHRSQTQVTMEEPLQLNLHLVDNLSIKRTCWLLLCLISGLSLPDSWVSQCYTFCLEHGWVWTQWGSLPVLSIHATVSYCEDNKMKASAINHWIKDLPLVGDHIRSHFQHPSPVLSCCKFAAEGCFKFWKSETWG